MGLSELHVRLKACGSLQLIKVLLHERFDQGAREYISTASKVNREQLFGKFGAKAVQAEGPVTQYLRNYSKQVMVSRLMPRMLEGEVLKEIYVDIANVWAKSPNFKESNNRFIKHYNGVVLVYNANDKVVVSIISSDKRKKGWVRI